MFNHSFRSQWSLYKTSYPLIKLNCKNCFSHVPLCFISWQNKEYCVSFLKFACLFFRPMTQNFNIPHINARVTFSVHTVFFLLALQFPWSDHIVFHIVFRRYKLGGNQENRRDYFISNEGFWRRLNTPLECVFPSSTSWKLIQTILYIALYSGLERLANIFIPII